MPEVYIDMIKMKPILNVGGIKDTRMKLICNVCKVKVRACVRCRHGDEKNDNLYKLEKASENLKLFKVELLYYSSLYSAIVGCSGVFHVASPVPSTTPTNPEVRLPNKCSGFFFIILLVYNVYRTFLAPS